MELTITQIFKIIKTNLILIIVSMIIGGGAFYSISNYLIEPTYTSTAVICVIPDKNLDSIQQNINDINYRQKILNTYIEILKTDDLYEKIVKNTKLPYSRDGLKGHISFKVRNNTEILQVDVTLKNTADAKIIADEVVRLAPTYIKEVYNSKEELLKTIQQAGLPTSPSSPNVKLNTIIGILAGFIFSFVIALIREITDVAIKDEDELAEKYNIPVLGTIPHFENQLIQKGEKSEKR